MYKHVLKPPPSFLPIVPSTHITVKFYKNILKNHKQMVSVYRTMLHMIINKKDYIRFSRKKIKKSEKKH